MKKIGIIHGIAALAILLAPAVAREPLRGLDDLLKIEQKTEALAEKVMPATVALIAADTGASGSGVITSADGLILTAAHVTDGVEEVEVVFPNGKQTTATVLGSNYSKDIGMARIKDEGPWPFAELGESKPLKAGDWVVAMGHSEGYDPARTPPMRFGRVVSDGPGNFLTTDCTLIGGDSGGPLFDLDGKVVGINSSIGQGLDNNNHAGIDGFREDWKRLIAGESWGELQLNPLANQERPVIGILMGRELRDGGVPVEQVTSGSPAAKAGVRPGDIIRSVAGDRINGGRELTLLLAKFSAGDNVKIGIQRGRQMIEVEMELVRRDQLFR
ncbi:S1C family serine protease [Haloferula chungangensis]|uniref:S1C family serine protease n=1 Tax=Haloferula chungangensis TaxID=1048331 RepID=A0ABW2L029_9BACT